MKKEGYWIYKNRKLIGEAVKSKTGYYIIEYKNLVAPSYYLSFKEAKEKGYTFKTVWDK